MFETAKSWIRRVLNCTEQSWFETAKSWIHASRADVWKLDLRVLKHRASLFETAPELDQCRRVVFTRTELFETELRDVMWCVLILKLQRVLILDQDRVLLAQNCLKHRAARLWCVQCEFKLQKDVVQLDQARELDVVQFETANWSVQSWMWFVLILHWTAKSINTGSDVVASSVLLAQNCLKLHQSWISAELVWNCTRAGSVRVLVCLKAALAQSWMWCSLKLHQSQLSARLSWMWWRVVFTRTELFETQSCETVVCLKLDLRV